MWKFTVIFWAASAFFVLGAVAFGAVAWRLLRRDRGPVVEPVRGLRRR